MTQGLRQQTTQIKVTLIITLCVMTQSVKSIGLTDKDDT